MSTTALQFQDNFDSSATDYAVGNTPFVGAWDSQTNSWIKKPDLFQKVGDLLGFTNYSGDYEAKLANNERAYERASIQSARAWEEYLSSTQYQRTMNDLKAAGLNPWLALQSGVSGSSQGSSTDTGGSSGKRVSNARENSKSALISLLVAVAKILSM